jgi:hypothetical protein
LFYHLVQIPERVRGGYLFEYELLTVHADDGSSTFKYTERVITSYGPEWEIFKEGDEMQTMVYPVCDIADSHELWQQALVRTNAYIYVTNQRILEANATLSAAALDAELFDFSDIDERFEKDGKGPHLLEMDFVGDTGGPVDYVDRNGRASKFWMWRHRLTGYCLRRFSNLSGRSFDTGRLSKYLKMIKEHENPLAYARAKHILQLNDSNLVQGTKDVPLVLERRDLLGQQVGSSKRFYNFCLCFVALF